MRMTYKFYYKENDILTIQYFRTLKQIRNFLKENAVIPMQINKYSFGMYSRFKVWSLV